MLQLLRGETKGVGKLFARAASAIIKEMLRQYPELAQKYVLAPIIEPLTQTTTNAGITALQVLIESHLQNKVTDPLHNTITWYKICHAG